MEGGREVIFEYESIGLKLLDVVIFRGYWGSKGGSEVTGV